MSIHHYTLYIISGWYCVHNNTPEDDKESLYSLATCTHTSYANDKHRAVFTSPYKCSSGAVGDRIVINHTGKQRHDKHSPYIIAVIIPSYTHTHTHTH